MNAITIQKVGITNLATDAIVNAANDGLWAGGGVCGAIFRAAGHDQLQAACSAIGHCDTGSAVITPGFALKAKYIIHAVGPVWRGGNNREPQQLYGAYQKSLELAVENGCHSIGFPLISAGIFGYPKDQAWRKAIQACSDFFQKNPDADLQVIFAVLEDEILMLGQQTLQEIAPEYDRNRAIHSFAEKYYHLYSNPQTAELEVDEDFPRECFALGFKMDAGESFIKAYSSAAFNQSEELKKIIATIDDVDLLGSAILSQYRWITHWAQTDLLGETYRPWFILAFGRLSELTE